MQPHHANLIRQFCATHLAIAFFDEPSATLHDVFSGKSITLAALQQVVERRTHDRDEPYLLIVYEDGRQLALAPAGVAFPPDFRNSGALAGMPQVVCWRDFSSVVGQAEHVLGAHPEEKPGRELLDLFRYAVAFLDGARAAGFETATEETRLERNLEELERRSRG